MELLRKLLFPNVIFLRLVDKDVILLKSTHKGPLRSANGRAVRNKVIFITSGTGEGVDSEGDSSIRDCKAETAGITSSQTYQTLMGVNILDTVKGC